MTKLRNEAEAYQPPQTKNIADLEAVSLDMDIEDREGLNKEGVTFKYKVIVVNGEDYRVPNKVLADLKSIMEVKPTLKTVKVLKKGEGMQTTYTVIPLE